MALPLLALATVSAAQIINGAKSAETMKRQARMQKAIADMNAKYIEIDAFNARAAGYTRAARYQTVVDRTIADQRLAMASANVDITSGTAKEIQTESRMIGELNQLDIIEQGQMKAYGLKTQAMNLRTQSEFNRDAAIAEADATAERAFVTGATTFVSGYEKMGGFSSKKTGHFG